MGGEGGSWGWGGVQATSSNGCPRRGGRGTRPAGGVFLILRKALGIRGGRRQARNQCYVMHVCVYIHTAACRLSHPHLRPRQVYLSLLGGAMRIRGEASPPGRRAETRSAAFSHLLAFEIEGVEIIEERALDLHLAVIVIGNTSKHNHRVLVHRPRHA